jgi:hypothetical protein
MDLKQRVPGLIGVVFFIPSRASWFVPAQRRSHVLGRRLAVKDDEVKRHRVVSKRRHPADGLMSGTYHAKVSMQAPCRVSQESA